MLAKHLRDATILFEEHQKLTGIIDEVTADGAVQVSIITERGNRQITFDAQHLTLALNAKKQDLATKLQDLGLELEDE